MTPPRQSSTDRVKALISDHLDQLVDTLTVVIRRQVAEDLRTYLDGAAEVARAQVRPRAVAAAVPRARPVKVKKAANKPRRILPCIAAGCGKPSKGPRFHYLCDEHRGAAPKQIEAWRQALGMPAARSARAAKTAARPKAKAAK